MFLAKNGQQMFMSSCIFLTTLTSFQFFYLWWENMNISRGAWVLPVAAVWRRKQKITLALIIIILCLVTSPRPPIGQHALSWPVIGWAGITNNCLEMREHQPVLPSGGFTFVTTFHVFQITQISNLLSSASRLCHKLNWLPNLMLEPQLVTHNFDVSHIIFVFWVRCLNRTVVRFYLFL